MDKEKKRNQEEYFHKVTWNTYTVFVLVFKINSLWKITLELMLVSVKKLVNSSCPTVDPRQSWL